MADLTPDVTDREVEMAVRTWIRNSGVPHTERMRRALESARWETQKIARPLQARIAELEAKLTESERLAGVLREQRNKAEDELRGRA